MLFSAEQVAAAVFPGLWRQCPGRLWICIAHPTASCSQHLGTGTAHGRTTPSLGLAGPLPLQVPFFKLTLRFALEYDADLLNGAPVATALRFAEPSGLLKEMQAAGLADAATRVLQASTVLCQQARVVPGRCHGRGKRVSTGQVRGIVGKARAATLNAGSSSCQHLLRLEVQPRRWLPRCAPQA